MNCIYTTAKKTAIGMAEMQDTNSKIIKGHLEQFTTNIMTTLNQCPLAIRVNIIQLLTGSEDNSCCSRNQSITDLFYLIIFNAF
jgi:hypothetical protein